MPTASKNEQKYIKTKHCYETRLRKHGNTNTETHTKKYKTLLGNTVTQTHKNKHRNTYTEIPKTVMKHGYKNTKT